MKGFDDVQEPLQTNRYFGSLFLLPIVAAFLLGGAYLFVMVGLMALRALYEFYQVVKNKGIKPLMGLGYAMGILQIVLNFFNRGQFETIAVILILMTVIALIVTVARRDHNFIDGAVTLLGYTYCVAFFNLALVIYDMPGGHWYVFTFFTIAWGCDTLAYFTGRFFGKRKLIPEISPKKTVEGAIGGLFGGALITMATGIILRNAGFQVMEPIHFLFMGLLGSVFSQIGDLIASAIKRECGVKDYPKLIPGHGGILDRFDSILLAIVSVFLYLTILFGY